MKLVPFSWLSDGDLVRRALREDPQAEGGRAFRSSCVEAGLAGARVEVIRLLNYLFLGGVTLSCLDAADSDDSGILDLTDTIYSLTRQFIGGSPPPAPFPDCGSDDTPDNLDCAAECS